MLISLAKVGLSRAASSLVSDGLELRKNKLLDLTRSIK